ncbi:MAG: SusF/SusE family outer membrane protein [Culturomica sp.]|nr:SusF/SusE family outer membrane protein [Culturomica sp.]
MKNIYGIIALLVASLSFFACSDDNDSNPTLLEPTGFVLNIPPMSSQLYDLENSKTIELTCTQPDYGFPAATVYGVQVATDATFSTYATMSTTYTTTKIEVSSDEVAVSLVGLLGVEKEEDFPTEPFPLHFRLTAQLGNGMGECVSNSITLDRVKAYYAIEDLVAPENMYMIGNVAGNWDWNNSVTMVPVYGTPGQFWAVQYLGKAGDNFDGDNAQIKFNYVKDWNGTEVGFSGVSIDEASLALGDLKDNGGNIEVGNPGWYIVVLTVTVENHEYVYNLQLLPPNVYLCGDVIGGQWGAGDGNSFTVPNVALGPNQDFVSPVFTSASGEGGIRASIVLPGHDWWHTEFMVFDGVLEYRGAGGDQARVAGAAGQTLSINFTNGTGSIN